MKIVHNLWSFFLIIVITIPFNIKAVEKKDLLIDEINLLPEYNIDLIWGNMEFTYVETDNYYFDENSNEYVLNRGSSWTSTNNSITINNNSSFAIEVTFSYQGVTGYSNITGIFSNSNSVIASGDTFSTALSLNGLLENSVVDFIKIGTITIEIV